jgi:hypothetical protein
VKKGSETAVGEIAYRAVLTREPSRGIPFPSEIAGFGTTQELFDRIQTAYAEQTGVSPSTSALLTSWSISTWFCDGLTLAPGLAILGPAYEADLVLRTLRNFSHYPLMLAHADLSSLRKASWTSTPTLIFFAPNISKQMARVLGCSTSRGYMTPTPEGYREFFGSKAIYLGEEPAADKIPHGFLRIDLTASRGGPIGRSLPTTEPAVRELQNQLLAYRQASLVQVHRSAFDAAGLGSETRMIANSLGACIVDAPDLQGKLVRLLTPLEVQRQTDRTSCLEAGTLEATLSLAHQGIAKVLVSEITAELNSILVARGERVSHGPETIGWRLKKLGLVTRRLGKSGNGLVLDLETLKQVHELATSFGGVGLDEEGNLNCPLCIETKRVMQEVEDG